MSTGEIHWQQGGDPYEQLRAASADYVGAIEQVTQMGLRLSPEAPEAKDFARATVEAVFYQWDCGRLPAIDAMPAELMVVLGTFELIRAYHRWVPMQYPYPGRDEYRIPTASRNTTYVYDRGVYESRSRDYLQYELQTVGRYLNVPAQKPRSGRVDILLAQSAYDGLWYPRPLAEQARGAGLELRSERVHLVARGIARSRDWLN